MASVKLLGALAASVVLSCSGHTETSGGSGGPHSGGGSSGGGAAGGGSGGGTGGSGAAGSTGTGAAGSSAGGSAGTGSGGTGGKNAIGEKIAEVCQALSETACSVEICLSDLLQHKNEAKLYGCNEALVAFLDCTESHPYLCTPYPAEYIVEPNPECAAQHAALGSCLPQCSGSENQTTCKLSCTGKISWSVECEKDVQQIQCVCTSGPHAGASATLGAVCGGLDMAGLLQGMCY